MGDSTWPEEVPSLWLLSGRPPVFREAQSRRPRFVGPPWGLGRSLALSGQFPHSWFFPARLRHSPPAGPFPPALASLSSHHDWASLVRSSFLIGPGGQRPRSTLGSGAHTWAAALLTLALHSNLLRPVRWGLGRVRREVENMASGSAKRACI